MSQLDAENRREPRTKTLLSGTVRDASTQSTMSCVVKNLGPHGARLAMSNSVWLADRFELDIAGRQGRRHARTVWRKAGSAGICFVDDEIAQAARSEAEIQALRLSNRDLQARLRQLAD